VRQAIALETTTVSVPVRSPIVHGMTAKARSPWTGRGFARREDGTAIRRSPRDEKPMRAVSSAILFAAAVLVSPVRAQDAVPDLKGAWSGVARSVVVGSGYHHPGSETEKEPPRIREVRFT
jgi:hypothetical protein